MNTKLILALVAYFVTLLTVFMLAVIGRISLMDLLILFTPSLGVILLAPVFNKIFQKNEK